MPDSLEVWGGVECTVNRVGDLFFDQLSWNGHDTRDSDLDLFAALGFKTIRYPLLWEKLAPKDPDEIDWSWSDRRLNRLRDLGIRPVVGLVHHGSGPAYTQLDDPAFPEKLAQFAGRIAERYPWLDAYTPINEPLTTARFSGLYGLWYPHGRSQLSFFRTLLNQVRGVKLAMKEIRKVNPRAQLYQTEDLGKTYSTPTMRYQAEYENHRRWLSLDLLFGRVNREHVLYKSIIGAGIPEAELHQVIEAGDCPPELLGLNYYVTSERFLDERLDRYPPHTHGGNGQHQYADVEVVRVCAAGISGHDGMLREVWERYHSPMVISEVHLGSTREEQMRWLIEAWRAASALREEGIDVRAITAWALLGIYNWHCIVTRDEGYYEPGIFDLHSGEPRPTGLASAVRSLIVTGDYHHPLLDTPGWWRRPERLLYPAVDCLPDSSDKLSQENIPSPAVFPHVRKPLENRPILITGARGTLGQAFQRLCQWRGIHYVALNRGELDISDSISVRQAFDQLKPWAVINTAGYVRVDDAEREQDLSWEVNVTGPQVLAEACSSSGIHMMTFSSDLVFDGKKADPYLESSLPAPLNHYGLTKAEAEARVMKVLPEALIIRTSAFFSPWDHYNFAYYVLQLLVKGDSFRVVNDVTVSPTYVPDLVSACLDLLTDGAQGIWHLANRGQLSWYDFAREIARSSHQDVGQVIGVTLEEMNYRALRPRNSALATEKSLLLPTLESAVARFMDTEIIHQL